MKRSRPKKKRTGLRRGPWRNEAKRRFIASLPCIITGRAAQCCHVTKNGTSSKGSDEFTVPLCPELHDQLDGRKKLPNGEYGNKRMPDGRYRFEHFYRVDLIARAIALHLDFMEETKHGNFNRPDATAA